jgi:uncharacterized protein YcbK (DUF882 family)
LIQAILRKSIRPRSWLAIGLLASLAFTPAASVDARETTRTLKLYFTHTGEKGEFTFKRNGRYDRKELEKINRFLRDWRRNEPTRMDPQLLDLVWSIYKQAGGRDYIHIVSAYRSLSTNNMLRKRSRGVAEKSQHTAGRAMDFFIPGVPLAKLRATAMKMQGGGVGYYPRSGSPFVHVDTGNVRSWPRMTREQLIALFPDGETLYLPADGKPLKGYEKARARRSSGTTALAYLETGSDDEPRSKPNAASWLKRVFGGPDEEEDEEIAAEPAKKPVTPVTKPAPAVEPPPAVEPATGEPEVLVATAEPDADQRLPKARPAAVAETVLASLSPQLPAEAAAAPAEQMATLAFAPLPRNRPDPRILADSLRGADGAKPLAVDAADAIAALTARAEPAESAQADGGETEVAALLRGSVSEADRAILAGFAAAGELPGETADPALLASAQAAAEALAQGATSAPQAPRPRPVLLAFTGAGLFPDDSPLPAASGPAPASREPATNAPERTAAVEPKRPPVTQVAVPADLAERIDAAIEPTPAGLGPVASGGGFSGFAMPQLGGNALFAPPEATTVTDPAPAPRLPADRFDPAASAPAPSRAASEESFFSRLFAGLAQ